MPRTGVIVARWVATLLVLVPVATGPGLADGTRLWEDPKTHQVYTEPGEGRVPLDTREEHPGTEVRLASKALKLEFSGVHFLGFVHRDPDDGPGTSKFETRRNHFQVKAFLDEKNYMRLTLDAYQETAAEATNADGSWNMRVKYAYLWLADVLPGTGIEIGQVHLPWLDYEESHGWFYRSISKTFIEAEEGAALFTSADLGVNVRTAFDHVSSEVVVVNGEGFHARSEGRGLLVGGRLVWHLLGTGRKRVNPLRDRYLDAAVLAVHSSDDEAKTDTPDGTDFDLAGLHVVYNCPRFLVAAMYVDADNDDYGRYEGHGLTVNLEIRPSDRWAILARRDDWDQSDTVANHGGDRTNTIVGVAWRYDRYVRFIVNLEQVDYDDADTLNAKLADENRLYVTAEVHW